MAGLPATSWWQPTMSDYGVGAGSTTPPIHLAEMAPRMLDDSDVQTWLAGKLDGTHKEFGKPDDNSLYVIFYPQGTTITLSGQQSCRGFGGYHSSVQLDSGKNVSYAVIPRCLAGGGGASLDLLTGAASHEIVEAATDADPQFQRANGDVDSNNRGWSLASGGEVGDLCEFLPAAFYRTGNFDYSVQRSWSNSAAKANRDPCVPAPLGQTYFNSAPVLTDTIHARGVTTKGILAKVGGSATIELDLWSGGPTQPWTVGASTMPSILGNSGEQLDFSFDNDTGSNGSKLHLTVKVISPGPNGYETFAITSTLGPTTNHWMVTVSDH